MLQPSLPEGGPVCLGSLGWGYEHKDPGWASGGKIGFVGDYWAVTVAFAVTPS